MAGSLGRVAPTDWQHVEKYGLRAVMPETVDNVERILHFYNTWRTFYNQGRQGACVGFASSEMMTVLNRRRYDAVWLWQQARLTDEWPENDDLKDPDQGTSVRAAMEILRTVGHEQIRGGKTLPAQLTEGITEYRWATSVDEVRSCLARGVPVVMGTDWYARFDDPIQKGKEWWIDKDGWDKTSIRGGHSFMFNGASDKRQAFRTPNTWGPDGYPQTWFPYEVVQKLIDDSGEAALVSDRL